jgi:hypothetical protein
MAATRAGDLIVSSVPDTHDVPFDVPAGLEGIEYQRILRELSVEGGHEPVAAFNSSI